MLEHTQPIVTGLRNLLDSFLEMLPAILTAILLLFVGWIVARLLRALTMRSAQTLNRAAQAVGLGGVVRSAGMQGSITHVLASIIYWLVILFFLTSATHVLGLAVFAGWLDELVGYLPNILSGCLIIFAGTILANIAREATSAALPSLSDQQRLLAGRLVQGLTLILLVIMGLDQIGIDITVIITVLSVAVAALLGGLSLAFSLGARTFVGNVIGAHYLDRDIKEGQRIRIRDMEGTVLEISISSVILETDEGRLTVPAHMFAEEAALILTAEVRND